MADLSNTTAAIRPAGIWQFILPSAVGVLITSQQYQRGFYSARESAVIAASFSISSLPFCLFTTEFIGLGHLIY
jgi:nucleoside recognition membrane protein YjiH